jgi:protein TonB
MAERHPGTSKTAQTSALVRFLPIIAIAIAIAIALYIFIPRGGEAPVSAAKPGAPATAPTSTAAPAASPVAAPAPELTVDQMLKAANAAFGEKRYIDPPGNNAVEYYLQVLAKEPKNHTADSALREMFPFATGAVEQEINGGNLDEAGRVIDELAKFDPSNYTLTILRGKLDAKKKQAEHDQQIAAAQAAAAEAKAAAEQKAAAAAAAAPPVEAAPQPKPVAPAVEKPVAPPPVVAAPAPAPVTTPAQQLTAASPEYPPTAYRSRTQGWVEVQFTVNTDGSVSDAKVVSAEPSRIFNNAALSAVKRWTFKPRMVNGQPAVEQVTRRIEFKMGGQ